MYKPSKYNYILKNGEEELFLYNSFNGNMGKVSAHNSLKVLEWMNGMTDSNHNDNFQKLINLGMLVPEDEDEVIKMNLIEPEEKSLNLIILPTEQCNFRCTYCYEEFKRGKMSYDVQNALIRFIKKNMINYTSLNVGWFGGEPLVAFDVIENLSNEFMKVCKSLRRNYVSNITTNGYLLDLPKFQKLLNYNVLSYQITIDGIKETHNKQKPLVGGGETFDVILGNLKTIKDNVKTGRFKIIVRTNVTKEINDYIDEYIQYFHNTFGDDDRFQFFIRPAGDWGGESVKEMNESLIGQRGIEKVFEKIIRADKSLHFIYRSFLFPTGSMCYAGKRNSYVIDSEGNIRKCSCNLDDDNNKLGSFDDKGDMVIDKYKYSQWIAKDPDNDYCKECFFLPVCQRKSCPALRVVHKQEGYACPYEKTNLDLTLQVLDKKGQLELLF